jgi:hypothetical protein
VAFVAQSYDLQGGRYRARPGGQYRTQKQALRVQAASVRKQWRKRDEQMPQLPLLLGFFDAVVLDDIVPSFFPTVLCTHDELHLEPHGAIPLAG